MDKSTKLSPLRIAFMIGLLLSALWLGWKAWHVNITMSCWRDEWPHLPVCDEIMGRTPQEKAERLEQRIKENPGDHQALVKLMTLAQQPNAAPHLDLDALLARALVVAPQHAAVLFLSAEQAIKQRDWNRAVDALTRLSHHHAHEVAREALAQMIHASEQEPRLFQALAQAAKIDSSWVAGVLMALPKYKVPTVAAMPLVDVLVEQQTLTPKLGLSLVRQLNSESEWETAHGVWLYIWNQPLPLIFNGDFEQGFLPGGFDWDFTGPNDHRGGARVDQINRGERGKVLRLSFNGKSIRTPMLRQVLMLRSGQYLFEMSSQANELRSAQGLVWVFSCLRDRREIGRTFPVMAVSRDWLTQRHHLDVPHDCGTAVLLELKTHAPYEATAGLRGEVDFDALSLTRWTATQ